MKEIADIEPPLHHVVLQHKSEAEMSSLDHSINYIRDQISFNAGPHVKNLCFPLIIAYTKCFGRRGFPASRSEL